MINYGGLLGNGALQPSDLQQPQTLWSGLLGNQPGANISPYYNSYPFDQQISGLAQGQGYDQLQEMLSNPPTPTTIPFGQVPQTIQPNIYQYQDSRGYAIPAQGYWNAGQIGTIPKWVENDFRTPFSDEWKLQYTSGGA